MKLINFACWLVLVSAASLQAATPGAAGPQRMPRIEPPAYWAPLVFKPGSATERSYREDEIKWFEKNLVPAISKSWEGQPWKDQALAFVRERLHYFQWYYGWERRPASAITPQSLADAGCVDPWVRLLSAWTGGKADRAGELAQSFEIIRDSGLDPALLRFAALPLLDGNSGLNKERQSIILEVFKNWTAGLGKSPCYAGKDGDLLFRHLRKLPAFRIEPPALLACLKEGNTMPSWIMDTLAGEAEVDLAWDSRGSGWASTVTGEGWKGFQKHLALARKHLVAAWQAKPDQPHAAAQMIVVVMGDGAKRGENERLWFDRATAACFDYESAYSRYRQALLPRWGGSYETMLAFGLACVDTGRFDTFAPMCYFEILNQMAGELHDFGAVYRQPEVAPRVKALNEALIKAAASPEEKADRQSFSAVDSWLTGDWATAHGAMLALQWKTTRAVQTKMGRLGISYNKLASDILVFGGKAGDLAQQAESRTRAGDPAGAVKLWKEWVEKSDGDAASKGAAAVRLRAAELAVEYAAGKWVNLPVERAGDWDWVRGGWQPESRENGNEGLTAIGKAADSFHCAVYPLSPGPRFELRAKFKLTGLRQGAYPYLQLNTGFNLLSNFGACTAAAGVDLEGFWGFLAENCEANRVGNSVRLLEQKPETAEFYFRRDEKSLTFAINNQPVSERQMVQPGNPDWEHGYISLGAMKLNQGQTLTITSVELRRLP